MSPARPLPAWRYATACVQGRSHEAHGVPCQDKLGVRAVADAAGETVLVAVVSDGAGSAANAALGAEALVGAMLDCAAADLPALGLGALTRETLEDWISVARSRLDLEAGPRSSYAATLCLALVGPREALYAQIGDGALVERDALGAWDLALVPQHGEEAGSTNFFTDLNWRDRLQVARRPAPAALALMSDGVETLAIRMADMTPHRPALEGLIRPVLASDCVGEDAGLSAGLAAWLASPAVLQRTHDDKALVLAAR